MDRPTSIAEQFEAQRPHLRAVAFRMLGSRPEADDAVQDAWLRLARADAAAIDNLGGWLTTVVARISLNMLRRRRARREVPDDAVHVPEPLVGAPDARDPEHEALLADSVGLALLVVLETLSPAERLAFVLHDVFAMSFQDIAPIVDRSPAAARQLASRARRRVQATAPAPDAGLPAQRAVVEAFFAAARDGDLARLVAVLDPDVVLRVDAGPAGPVPSVAVRGAESVAGRAMLFADPARRVLAASVNGAAGVVVLQGGVPVSVMGFTVVGGVVAAIDVLADRDRLARVDLGALADAASR
jgi:RNA polymerase sigma-70 factor (ECF subfamily)